MVGSVVGLQQGFPEGGIDITSHDDWISLW